MPPERPLRVGYNRAFRPFAVEENGLPAGLAVDRARAALAAAGLDAGFVPLDLPEMFDRLLGGDVDLLAGTGVSQARAERYAFSRPLVATGGAWFPGADVYWPTDNALRTGAGGGRRVVTPAAGPLAGHIAEHFPQLDLATCSDYEAALGQVTGGKADAAALNFHVGLGLVAGDGRFTPPTEVFLQIDLALAAPAGDPRGLLARLDPHIPPPG